MDIPYRKRSFLADDAGKYRDAATVTRRDRNAGDHRLSSAGDARRDRSDPRRDYPQGDARRSARTRRDPPTRPPQDAGASTNFRNHARVLVAVQSGGAWRPAGPG